MEQTEFVTVGKNRSGKIEYPTNDIISIPENANCMDCQTIRWMAEKIVKVCLGWQEIENKDENSL